MFEKKKKTNMFNSYGASISGIFLLFATYCWHQLVLMFVFEELKKRSVIGCVLDISAS